MIDPSWKAYAEWLLQYHAGTEVKTEMLYLAAPYSKVEDKEAFMQQIMAFSGQWQLAHPGQHICSPLFNHFSLAHVPGLGSDYAFWQAYSGNMLKRCDRLVVICVPGWQESTGVADEVRIATELGLPVTYVSEELFRAVTNLNPAN